eukprot:24854-Eustigmatos_ZCMA.PRE.1
MLREKPCTCPPLKRLDDAEQVQALPTQWSLNGLSDMREDEDEDDEEEEDEEVGKANIVDDGPPPDEDGPPPEQDED